MGEGDAADVVADWLRRRLEQERSIALFGAAGTGVLGLVLTGITYLAILCVLWFFFGSRMQSMTGLYVLAAVAIGLLFWGNATTDPSYLNQLEFSTGTQSDKIVVIDGRSNINPLAPNSAHSIIKIITSTLYQGPRQFGHCARCLRRLRQLKKVDIAVPLRVISRVYAAGKRVNLSELSPDFEARELNASMALLASIPGVAILTHPEPGLTLTDSARDEISGQT